MLFDAVGVASRKVMMDEELDSTWKEELEEYIVSNKES